MRTAIVTDSTAYLTEEEMQQYGIHMVPLTVNIEGQLYDEGKDITDVEFYNKVRGAKVFPKTTQPPIGKFVELFEQLANDYDAIITIHLSGGISGTYQGAVQAGQMVDGIDVYAFDSQFAAALQGYFVLTAAELAQQGVAAQSIIEQLEQQRETSRANIVVDDLGHLQRGGRLSAAAALIGGLLQVKPILHFVDGKIVPAEKVRTRKKALKRVEEILAADADKYGALNAAVIHANCEEEARAYMEELAAKYPSVTFKLSHFGPVVGTHLGEGSIAVGWHAK
ncbi:DegV family protein [Caryophanon latum]|uniref:Fatty acid-binding protein DegV n=1 Tax=Caryophanon latum TaxID=33977 RepID=A0A1C0YI69_9BACL|nr:DegV family protein [Caryophanon latum]OCS86813.1 fatty acid-binding protein DegV [Caryophanon latum]